jgi:lipopolysaccharide/colanic/teichoic acid biosynthesis glycosyltransferase
MGRLEESAKRAFDLFFSTLGLALLSPFFLIVGLIIKHGSKGPVFYRGVRTGRYGKPFRMWKFRTMHINSESLGVTTGKDDPRVTRAGRFLRKYKIDELPQLINVLKGEMSLVGPRPEFNEHTSAYMGEERLILTVRPGITDYASVQFYDINELVGSEDPHRVFIERFRPEKNRLRVAYVKQQSFGEDLRILFQTLARVIVRR